MKTLFHKKQKGLTLIELIAGLAIVAAVIIGALSLFGNANSGQKSGQIVTDSVAMRTAIRHLFSATGNYVGASGATGPSVSVNDVLAKSSKVPSNIRVTGTNPAVFSHAFNGTITTAIMGTYFYITYNNIPQDACINILTGSSGWPRITVGATAPTGVAQAPGTNVLATPINAVAAEAACTSPDNNIINFVSN